MAALSTPREGTQRGRGHPALLPPAEPGNCGGERAARAAGGKFKAGAAVTAELRSPSARKRPLGPALSPSLLPPQSEEPYEGRQKSFGLFSLEKTEGRSQHSLQLPREGKQRGTQ